MPDQADEIAAVVGHVSETVPRLLADQDLPGLAVGVCDKSGILWSAGFGRTVRGGGVPVTTQTLFNLMSGSKMYTATAVLLAVQDGLLDLDEPLVSYLPDFTVHSTWELHPERRMTLRILLSHRSGLTHEARRGSNFDHSDVSFDDHCRSISDTWLRFPVGHHAEYGNLAFDLAAWTVERVTGPRFADYVRDVLLRPLELGRTTYDRDQIVADVDRAVGHSDYATPPPVRVPMVGAAGVYASVDDVLAYLAVHLREGAGLLDPDLLEQMYDLPGRFPGQRLGFGLGVSTSDWGGRTVRGHSGGGFGFLCDLGWDPAAGLGVAVLANSDDHPLQAGLATQILQLMSPITPAHREQEHHGPQTVAEETQPAVDNWPGDYVDSGSRTTRVAVVEGTLTLERDGVVEPLRLTGLGGLVTEGREGAGGEVFLLLHHHSAPGHDYLVRVVDGVVSYRNPARDPAGDEESFAVDYLGSLATTLVLRRNDEGATLTGTGYLNLPPLTLTEQGPGLWSSSVGEVLDLSTSPPTYANIPLRRFNPDPDTKQH